MKNFVAIPTLTLRATCMAAGLTLSGLAQDVQFNADAGAPPPVPSRPPVVVPMPAIPPVPPVPPRPGVRIEVIEAEDLEDSAKDAPWLGVAANEAPEALAAQLDLSPGSGLVVTYVAADSPAAKAGLVKNDVLVLFEDQTLVHPVQLRKLLRARQAGDSVKLTYYHAGKRQTTSVVLAKSDPSKIKGGTTLAWQENFRDMQRHFKDMKIDDELREQMKALQDHLSHLKVDQKKIEAEVRHSVDEARKAVREALRNATNSGGETVAFQKALQEIMQSKLLMERDAKVTVRSKDKGVKSLVRSDDHGTIVLLNQPKLHLTAHDKEGKLIFDGEIENAEQKAKVPRELLEEVEPLLEKMDQDSDQEREAKQVR